jgi:starvation-inducible DNA-binding protein
MKIDNAMIARRKSPLKTPTSVDAAAARDIAAAMNALLADVFCLFLKTKNFHWHVSGPHFRDYHLLFDEQAAQILAMSDGIAERVRKLGGTTLRSISHIGRIKRLSDNDADYVDPQDMLSELREDNEALVGSLREIRDLCDEGNDAGTLSYLDPWINQSEQRIWFLFETSRQGR